MNIRIALIAITTGLFISGCSGKKNSDEQSSGESFPITQLITRDTVLARDYVADIHAMRNIEMRARAKGYLDHIYVDEGQEVKQGQLLFQINEQEYEAEVAQAKANLSNYQAEAEAMQVEVERIKILVDKKVLADGELRIARTRLASANAKVAGARSVLSNASIRLSHAYIKAPFDGVTGRIPFKIGSLIDEGSLLTTISDTKSVLAYFEVSENEYLDYITKSESTGLRADEAELVLANGKSFAQKGKIETVVGEFESNSGTIAFRARFANPDKVLKHGSSGKVRLTRELKNVVIIPQKATFEIQDRTFVYVVNEKNEVKMKSFIPSVRFSHFYIVKSGLRAGEKIVYEGIQSLRDGMKIRPSYLQMDSLLLLQASLARESN